MIFTKRIFFLAILLCSSLGLVSGPPTTEAATQRPYVINGIKYYPIPSSDGFSETGIASWYGEQFHGNLTSNGETYDMYDMTAAHKTLPMHTTLLVTNMDNNKRTVVRVNDRGPFVAGRIIDLSYTAAQQIGIHHAGLANVKIQAISPTELKQDANGNYIAPNLKTGNYYVQVGAFLNKANADKLQKKFDDRGHITRILKVESNRGPLYRVHIFAGYHYDLAKGFERDLIDAGYKGSFLFAR